MLPPAGTGNSPRVPGYILRTGGVAGWPFREASLNLFGNLPFLLFQQLPLDVQYRMLNIPYNNYKTQACKFYAEGQPCHYGKNCTYAHGNVELRQPYQELPPDALPSLEISNPSAFRLLNAQV